MAFRRNQSYWQYYVYDNCILELMDKFGKNSMSPVHLDKNNLWKLFVRFFKECSCNLTLFDWNLGCIAKLTKLYMLPVFFQITLCTSQTLITIKTYMYAGMFSKYIVSLSFSLSLFLAIKLKIFQCHFLRLIVVFEIFHNYATRVRWLSIISLLHSYCDSNQITIELRYTVMMCGCWVMHKTRQILRLHHYTLRKRVCLLSVFQIYLIERRFFVRFARFFAFVNKFDTKADKVKIACKRDAGCACEKSHVCYFN